MLTDTAGVQLVWWSDQLRYDNNNSQGEDVKGVSWGPTGMQCEFTNESYRSTSRPVAC